MSGARLSICCWKLLDMDRAKTEARVGIQYLVFLANRKKSHVARAHEGWKHRACSLHFIINGSGSLWDISEIRRNVM